MRRERGVVLGGMADWVLTPVVLCVTNIGAGLAAMCAAQHNTIQYAPYRIAGVSYILQYYTIARCFPNYTTTYQVPPDLYHHSAYIPTF